MLELHTLGTSSAVPTPRRDLFANLIRFHGDRILIDAGEGVQKSLITNKLGFMQIDRVFITHWHADHFAGLIGLIQTMAMENREKPLHVYGPEDTHKFIDQLLEIGYFTRPFEIRPHELQDGDVVECTTDKTDYTVTAFETDHGIPSRGYVFEEETVNKASRDKMETLGLEASPKIGQLLNGETIEWNGEEITPDQVVEEMPGRKIVITGDTEYSKNTIAHAEDADILVHDATVSHEMREQGRERHASAREAAEVAKQANVKLLVLSHLSRKFDMEPDTLQNEARDVFTNTVVAEDGMQFGVKAHRPERDPEIKINS